MLINLVPEFLSVTSAPDPERAYERYREQHRAVLDAYWRNYVLDPDSPQADEVVRAALSADRSDIRAVVAGFDLAQMVEETVARAADVLGISQPTDVYLMVGMGAANAGELVLNGRGAAFICIEHFTGRPNAQSYGMGLSPERIPLWVAHELAHAVRYTAPDSRSEMRRLVAVRQDFDGGEMVIPVLAPLVPAQAAIYGVDGGWTFDLLGVHDGIGVVVVDGAAPPLD